MKTRKKNKDKDEQSENDEHENEELEHDEQGHDKPKDDKPAANAGCKVDIQIDNPGVVNIYNCSTPSGTDTSCFLPIGACFPVVPGAKHKLSREYKLAQLANGIRVPSSIAAGTMHMARRFLRGKKAANPLEKAVFATLRHLPRDLLSCAIAAFDELPTPQRKRLFAESLLLDFNQPLDEATLTAAFAQEIKQRVGIQAFGDSQAIEEERPGLIRVIVPNSEIPPTQILICTINNLRTAGFTPIINDYRPEELQQDCEIQLGETQPVCQIRTTNCPGNSKAINGNIVCTRVLDIAAGESVTLEGTNFFSIDAKVRFIDKQTQTVVRDVDAHVWGDIDTPLQDDAGVLINDCRVHDRLTFTVPNDLLSTIYDIRVVVPNITGIDAYGTELISDAEFINVIPPATARFEIVLERITCKEETEPGWLGSDELGMHTMAAALDLEFNFINLPAVKLSPDGANEPSLVQDQRFQEGDFDSDDVRDSNKLVFKHDQPILAMLLCVLGDEIDNDDAYEKEITSSSGIFLDLLKTELGFIFSPGGFAGISGILAAIVKIASVKVAIVVAAIAAAITIAIDIIIALWAPADPLIRDSIALTVNDLDALTNVSVPAPDPFSFSTEGPPIRVNVNMNVPPEKLPLQYRETREYQGFPGNGDYEITYRYNRVA